MKKFVLMLAVGLISGAALAVVGSENIAQETQIATRAAPTASSFTVSSGTTVGAALSLNDTSYFRVSVCAGDAGDGLQATGTLKAYLYDERAGLVMPNKQLDLDLSLQAAGNCIQFPDQKVGVPYDRVMYAASGLKLTDGGTLAYITTLSDGGVTYDGGAFVIRMRGWKVP